jgi:beta-mannosidase
VDGHDVRELHDGWQVAAATPDEREDPRSLDGLEWTPAVVPGTVAGSLLAAGRWRSGESAELDERDWWFRARFEAQPAGEAEQVVLALDGIATVAAVYLNGARLLESDSMFHAHELDVGALLCGENELAIRCRALGPLLRAPRRPRARWRTRLVAEGNLRFFRTMLLGRAPGFAPGPPAIGPWRPVRLERRRQFVVDGLELRPRVERTEGRLSVRVRIRRLPQTLPIDALRLELVGPNGAHCVELALEETGRAVRASGELVIPDVAVWWPHTHGDPVLHDARLLVDLGGRRVVAEIGQVGFRSLSGGEALLRDGIQLRVNDVPVFARGAVWTPPDLVAPCSPEGKLRSVLESVVAGGMNMLRVPGIGCYESDAFYELCDELGILVWQDFMFANLDYPELDPGFMDNVRREVLGLLGSLGGRPCLAVLCGGSEVAQQVAMLGLDPELANGPLFGALLPTLVEQACLDAVYVPSAPWGGDLPFRTDRGVANYYGVGAYLRGFDDVRRSAVRFAAECLAFSNVPSAEAIESMAAAGATHHPAWKAGVPRDTGAGWDFEDVRDHYLRLLFGSDPVALRSIDQERYLELSRAVTGEVMAEVFGEWRRESSPCGGGLVLWLTDLVPGAGWGVLDDRGEPKAAYHHLRRAFAPVATWSTDEGLGGVVAHVANDRAEPLTASLRIALYRDREVQVGTVEHELELAPHSACAHNVEELLGRFVDASWAYRFGPPAQDLIVLSLERHGGHRTELLSQSFRLPAGRPAVREPAGQLGVSATMRVTSDSAAQVTVSSRRFAYGVSLRVPGFICADDAFSVEPGHERSIDLRRLPRSPEPGGGSLTALNLAGRVQIAQELR